MDLSHDVKTHYNPKQIPIQTTLPLIWVNPGAWDSAHYVPLLPGSKEPAGPWRHHHPDYSTLLQHVAAGGNAGLVPGSVSVSTAVLACLDQDVGRAAPMLAAYPPLAAAPTSTDDRHHLYYWTTVALCNGTWRGPGGCAGEVRGAAGYVMQHGNEMEIVDQGLGVALPPGFGWLPDHLIVGGGHALNADVDTVSGQALALAWKLWDEVVGTVRRVDIGVAPGQRHVALVRRVTSWAGRRTWNTAEVTEEYIARRAAAYWLGLRDRQTFPEDEAVGVLSWALATRERMQAQPHTPEFLVKQAWKGRKSGTARRGRVADRDAAIVAAVAAGRSMRSLAREHGLDHKAVAWIVNREITIKRDLFSGVT